jgi:hypothetical protein
LCDVLVEDVLDKDVEEDSDSDMEDMLAEEEDDNDDDNEEEEEEDDVEE